MHFYTFVHGLFNMGYDTDLTDCQWSFIQRYIPAPKTGGRRRTTDEREVVDAILYLLKSGCHWRLLPKEFPPWQTVYRYFVAWRRKGVIKRIHYAIYQKARIAEGKKPDPTALVIDSQSVKTGKCAAINTRGFDGGKKVKGRKRNMVTDTLGLLVDVSTTRANLHDTKGAKVSLRKFAKRQKKKTIKTVFADKGYRGDNLAGWVKANLGATMQIGNNMTVAGGAFVPAKKRWVVERGFAWLGDYYRLSVDRERLQRNSNTMVRLAFIRLMLRRLWPE